MLTTLLVHSLLTVTAPLPPQEAHDLAGAWRGAAEIPGTPIEFVLAIERDDAGELTGTIDIPVQNAKGLALGAFSHEDGEWRFRIEHVPGEPTFVGTLSEDGAQLSGEFSQSGLKFPFALARFDSASSLDAIRERLAGLDEWVTSALEEWNTPGLAIAVVNADGLVLAQGFGQRDIEHEFPVTEETLFAIGSSSKAFTAALLGDLLEEGLLDWDAPVREYLPTFQLEDEYATAHLTVRDMLTHRCGLPRHDLAWYGSDATRRELFDRLRYLEPSAELRERFQYQNLMFMTGGYLAGQLTDSSWEEQLSTRFLEPLGMTGSVLSIDAMTRVEDRALAYSEEDDALELIPYRVIDAVGPAGSINSSARDMARWLSFLIARGEIDGHRILEESTFAELLKPVTVVPGRPTDSAHEGQSTYALGWMVQSYRGHERIHHGGGIDGFTALVTVLPRERVGIVALSNRGGSSVPNLATSWILDRVLELEPIDWSGLMRPLAAAAKKAAAEREGKASDERVEGTQPSHPIADYPGDFEHPGYGRMSITLDGESLHLAFNSFDEPLEHWHYDSFRITRGPAEGTLVQFHTDETGAIAELSCELESRVPAIVFERRAPAELTDPTFLASLVGRYDMGPQEATLALRGTELTLTVPGQPTYTLSPWREREFRLKELEGYSMRVVLEDGRCNTIAFVQPNGTFTGKRITD